MSCSKEIARSEYLKAFPRTDTVLMNYTDLRPSKSLANFYVGFIITDYWVFPNVDLPLRQTSKESLRKALFSMIYCCVSANNYQIKKIKQVK